MSRLLVFILSAAFGCCVAAVGAAQSQAQIPQPSFSSSVDIVSVDVNVVDPKGQPIRDLGRDDFTLMVDGKMRKITSAQFISVEASKAPPGPAVPAPSFNTNAAPPGRMIALVVDRGSITPVRSRDIFAAAARFVHGLDPTDLVALYTIPTGPNIDFTADHSSVEAALGHIDGQGDFQRGTMGIGIAEALAFEKNNTIMMDQTTERLCGTVPVNGRSSGSENLVCTKMVKEESTFIASYGHERARNTINGLRARPPRRTHRRFNPRPPACRPPIPTITAARPRPPSPSHGFRPARTWRALSSAWTVGLSASFSDRSAS